MILVTGGAGFIGSNLVEELLKQGSDVRVIDNFDTGQERNLGDLSAEVVRGDITDPDTVKRALEDVNQVYHQAAIGSVPRSIKDPATSTKVNVLGTLNVLTAARDSGVEKVVYASSASVYAGVDELPKREDMTPIPMSVYGATKIMNEYYFRIFHDIYGLKSTGMRYFNVYGPKQSPDSEYAAVIPKFINLMLSDKIPKIFGDGEQTRDFTYVGDVVKANLLAMKAAKSDGTAYNIAGGKRTSLNSLVDLINKALNKSIEPEYLDPRPGDPKHSLADITRAKHDIGYEPGYAFEDGLKLTIDWFRKAHI